MPRIAGRPPSSPAHMKRSTLATYALIFVCMATFCLLTPLISDDYYFGSSSLQPFASIMAGDAVEPFGREGFEDIFRRAAQMYGTWDGRFMAYVTFGFYLWLPQALYALLVAGIFCLTVHLALLHALGPDDDRRRTPFLVGLMAAALLWGMPTCGSIYFWRTGLAYAMDICCALLFLLPFRSLPDGPESGEGRPLSPAAVCGFWLLALYFGMLQYNTPILCLLAGSAAIWRSWRRGARLRPMLPLLGGLAILGAGLCVIFAAPGNAQRVLIRADWFLGLDFWDKLRLWLLAQPKVQTLFWLPWALTFWALWVLFRRYGRAFPRRLPLPGLVALLLGQMGQGAYLFAPAPDSRAYTSSFLFMLLGGCILARAALEQAAPETGRRARRVAGVFLALALLSLPHELYLFLAGKAELDARDAVYAASAGKDARVEPLRTRGDRFFVLGAYQQDISQDPDFWINQVVARYWNLSSAALRLPPPRVFSHVEEDGRRVDLVQNGAELSLRPVARPAASVYYVYYYGKPGLVRYLPATLADALTRWIGRGRPGDWRLWLTPLLYAQARLRPGDTEPATLWGLYPVEDAPLWLVRPGDGPASFRLLPLSPGREAPAP